MALLPSYASARDLSNRSFQVDRHSTGSMENEAASDGENEATDEVLVRTMRACKNGVEPIRSTKDHHEFIIGGKFDFLIWFNVIKKNRDFLAIGYIDNLFMFYNN